jgi:hypothetical protein
MDRSSISKILEAACKLPNSLLTVLDETRALYEQPSGFPKPEVKKRRKTDIRTIRRHRREARQSVWNEEKADAKRRQEGTLKEQYHKLRREVLRRGRGGNKDRLDSKANWDWNLSLDDWMWMWFQCPPVPVGLNTERPAWELRGRDHGNDVQLKRVDIYKPFEINNLVIRKGKQVLYP